MRSGSGQRQIISENTSGVNSLSGGVTTTNNLTFDVAAGGTLRLAGAITNNTTVTNVKSGGGTLIYAAATTGGTDNQLKVGNGAIVLGVNNAGTTNTGTTTRAIDLGLDGANTSTANNVFLYASNGVTVSNSIFVAANSSGATRTIGIAGAGSATFNNEIFLTGTLTADSGAAGNNLTVSGALLSAGGLTKTGAGTLTLSGANTYAGTTTIREGTLSLTAGASLGNLGNSDVVLGGAGASANSTATLTIDPTATVSLDNAVTYAANAGSDNLGATISGGTVSLNSTARVFNVANSAGAVDLTVSSTLANGSTPGSAVFKQGTGTMRLSGTNTYSGGTTIQVGTLLAGGNVAASTNGAFGNNANAINLGRDGTTAAGENVALLTDGAFTISRGVTVGTGLSGTTNFTSTLGGNTDNTSTFSGAITMRKDLTISQVATTGTNALQITGGIAGSTTAANKTVTFAGPGAINVSGAAIANGTGGGTMALNVTGGTTILANANTYSGGTTLSAGDLRVANASGLGTGTLSQVSGASTLQFSNADTVTNTMSVYNVAFLTGGNNLSGRVTNNSATYDVAAGTTNTISGYMTGPGGVVKTGEGVLSVTGATNDYASGTTIANGTLRGGNDSAFGTGVLQMNGGAISSDSAAARNFANPLTLGGDATFGQSSGGTGSLTFSSTATNNLGGGTRTLTTVVDTKIDGAFGNGSLTKAGAGTLYLSNASSSFGTLTINAGRITFQTNASITGLDGAGGSLQIAGGTLTVNLATNATYSDSISGSGSLAKTGTGTLTLGVANTFAGGTTLSDGVLRVSDTAGLGTGALIQTSGASTVQFSNAGTVANNMSVYNVAFLTGGNNLSGLITNNNATYDVAAGTTNTLSGFVTGSGGLTKTGEGVLSVTGTTNDYAGATTISNGTLRVTTLADAGAVSSIGTNATVNFSGTNASTTVLDYTGGNVTTDRSLVFNGVATNGEGGTLRVSNSSTVVTLDGAASGTGRMIVDGGTVVLSNTTTGNSFAPASIQVNSNSILQIAANEQIGNSTDLILNGGTLRLFNGTTGYAETLGTLTLSASSTIDLGAATTLRNITFANSSAITWTGTLTITNWQGVANTTGDAGRLLFGSGGLTSGQMSQVYWAGPGFTGSGGALIGPNGELVPIPEPRVYAAAIALLAAVGWRERRRILSLVNLKAKPRA